LKAKENKQRSKAQELQRQLENSQQRASQLVLARRQAARLTTRINEHEYQLQTLRTNFQALQNEKNAIVAEKNQFEAQANIWKKTKQRMETKMNALLNENEQLKSQLKQAQKKEMTAVKSLALVARASSGAMARKTTEENDAGIPNASGMCGPPPTPVSLIEGSNSSTPGNGSAELQSQFPDEEIKDQPHCKRLRSTTSSYSATKTTTDTVRSKIPRPTLRRPVPSSRITSTSRTVTGCANNK
jgi:uncharacterized phage infection (PIP) family protein YhgE